MKTKLRGILTLLLAFFVHLSFAQEKTVSGSGCYSCSSLYYFYLQPYRSRSILKL